MGQLLRLGRKVLMKLILYSMGTEGFKYEIRTNHNQDTKRHTAKPDLSQGKMDDEER